MKQVEINSLEGLLMIEWERGRLVLRWRLRPAA